MQVKFKILSLTFLFFPLYYIAFWESIVFIKTVEYEFWWEYSFRLQPSSKSGLDTCLSVCLDVSRHQITCTVLMKFGMKMSNLWHLLNII